MKNLALTVFVVLLITGSLVAANAAVIYQDNFSVQDYALRYNTDRSATWPQPAWQYADGGFEPGLGVGTIGFSTTSYLGGNFTNTDYTVQTSWVALSGSKVPALNIGLLDNGWGPPSGNGERYFGYDAEFNYSGEVCIGLHRINLDGSVTELVPTNYSWVTGSPQIWDANVNVVSSLTASVDVLPTETDITFTWNGVKLTDGTPTSYSISYQDTSAGRYTSGTGIGFAGYAGEGTANGMVMQNFTVSSPVPEPSSFVAFACGLISLLGLRRRRA